MIVLGIDPGGRNTGIVLRDRDVLLGWQLAVRRSTAKQVDGPYIRHVLACALGLIADASPDDYIVAVETVAWWPDKGQHRNHTGLYGTAMVVGGILARWPDAVVVDAGRGVANLHPQAYPAAIRPPVNGAGKDRLNHVRAAWDHSHAGETAWKTAKASR
jgi:hypothetical protein